MVWHEAASDRLIMATTGGKHGLTATHQLLRQRQHPRQLSAAVMRRGCGIKAANNSLSWATTCDHHGYLTATSKPHKDTAATHRLPGRCQGSDNTSQPICSSHATWLWYQAANDSLSWAITGDHHGYLTAISRLLENSGPQGDHLQQSKRRGFCGLILPTSSLRCTSNKRHASHLHHKATTTLLLRQQAVDSKQPSIRHDCDRHNAADAHGNCHS